MGSMKHAKRQVGIRRLGLQVLRGFATPMQSSLPSGTAAQLELILYADSLTLLANTDATGCYRHKCS